MASILLAIMGAGPAAAVPPKRTAAAGTHVAAAARKPVLKPFTFKTVTAGVLVGDDVRLWCEKGQPDEQNCRAFYENDVAGVRLPEGIHYSFYKHMLSGMFFEFANGNYQFETLALAFEDKYGAPCSKSTAKWQNQAGVVFDNPTLTWCFSSGKLTLQQRWLDRDAGQVEYQDDNRAPAKPTPKNF